jgi:hypothetical protein
MKLFIRTIYCVLVLALLPAAVPAQGPDAPQPGFSGKLQAGGLFLQTDSQLSTEGTNRRTGDLDGPANPHLLITGLATVSLRYRFESGTTLYAGNPLEVGEGLSLAAGVSQPLGWAGTLDLSISWLPIEEVWENPYLVNSARDETGVDAYGFKVEWQGIGGSPWEVSYKIDHFDVEDDVIGDLEADLERDGWTHDLVLKYTIPLSPGTNVKPELAYSYADKEGSSNSHHCVKAGALLVRARPPWVLVGGGYGAFHQYQKTHPLFDRTRQEGSLTTFAQVMRLNLFGNPRLFATLMGAYVWSDSNIDFFDSRTTLGLATVGITF